MVKLGPPREVHTAIINKEIHINLQLKYKTMVGTCSNMLIIHHNGTPLTPVSALNELDQPYTDRKRN